MDEAQATATATARSKTSQLLPAPERVTQLMETLRRCPESPSPEASPCRSRTAQRERSGARKEGAGEATILNLASTKFSDWSPSPGIGSHTGQMAQWGETLAHVPLASTMLSAPLGSMSTSRASRISQG